MYGRASLDLLRKRVIRHPPWPWSRNSCQNRSMGPPFGVFCHAGKWQACVP